MKATCGNRLCGLATDLYSQNLLARFQDSFCSERPLSTAPPQACEFAKNVLVNMPLLFVPSVMRLWVRTKLVTSPFWSRGNFAVFFFQIFFSKMVPRTLRPRVLH